MNLEDESIEAGGFVFELEEKGKTFNSRDGMDVFLDLCDAVELAFPDFKPTDENIRKHPLTPYLMRYFLASLRRVNISSQKTNSPIDAQLAKAFLIITKRGKMVTHRSRMQSEAAIIRKELESKNLSPSEVRKKTIRLVYERVYRDGNAGESKYSERKKALSEIEELLDAQGYLPYMEQESRGSKTEDHSP